MNTKIEIGKIYKCKINHDIIEIIDLVKKNETFKIKVLKNGHMPWGVDKNGFAFSTLDHSNCMDYEEIKYYSSELYKAINK